MALAKTRIEGIKPTYDIIAKRILSNTDITLQFIKDILDLPAVKATILDGTQIHLAKSDADTDFYMSVDVLVELDDQSQVIIEIQILHQEYFINRIWGYMCAQVNSNIEKIRKETRVTHTIYEKLTPVYVIAVTEENYFPDDRAFRTFSMRDDETKEVLKTGTIDGIKDRSITRIAFLELKKYDSEIKYDYKKVKWLEFFGNKPYTKEPDELLNRADTMLDMRNWTEEEKKMFDEKTRMYEQQQAAYASAIRRGLRQGHEKGRKEGIKAGREEGREEGRIYAFTSLVQEGLLTKEIASEKLGISVSEFEKYL